MKIMLVGGCFAGNMGGDAMYETFIEQLRNRFPKCEVVVLTKYPKDEFQICKERGYSVFSFTTVQRIIYGVPFWVFGKLNKPQKNSYCAGKLLPALRQYYECDLVVDFSGISFSDYRSFADLIINSTWFLPAFVTRVPIIKMSQSLGPYDKVTTKLFAKYCLNRIKVIVARGSESYKVTKKFLPNKKGIFNLPDVAMCLNPSDKSRRNEILSSVGINADEKYVVLGPSVVVNERYGKDKYEELFEKIVLLVAEKTGLPILFVPHTRNLTEAVGVDYASDDLDICHNIARRQALKDIDIRIIEKKYNARELKSVIGASEFAIGSRYHFLIAALSSGVPAVALGWGHKYVEMFELFDMKKYAFEYHNFDDNKIISAVNELIEFHAQIKMRIGILLPKIKKQSQRNGELVFKILERKSSRECCSKY